MTKCGFRDTDSLSICIARWWLRSIRTCRLARMRSVATNSSISASMLTALQNKSWQVDLRIFWRRNVFIVKITGQAYVTRYKSRTSIRRLWAWIGRGAIPYRPAWGGHPQQWVLHLAEVINESRRSYQRSHRYLHTSMSLQTYVVWYDFDLNQGNYFIHSSWDVLINI